jgi:hypothetical protein
MNKRIRELAEQARKYAEENRPGSFVKYDPEWFALYNQKFAELIVKECIELNRQELSFSAFARMLDKYDEHFGVKE